VFGGHIQAVAEGAVRAEAPTQVHARPARWRGCRSPAALAQVCACGALDDIVDQAAGRAGAGLDAAGALEDLDALLVVQGMDGFGADGQASRR
jgi:hypothetical protein